MVDIAKGICLAAHANQYDKAGKPYWKHPFAVYEKVRGDEIAETVALLHDVIEDTDITDEHLRIWGFPEEVVERVVILTHDKYEPYLEYVERAAKDDVTRKVKLADIEHNTDPSRADSSSTRLMKKYESAKEVLLQRAMRE